MKPSIPRSASEPGRRRSVNGRVLDELRTALLAGEFEAGARLPESALATRLGVSRAPVREAFRSLADEGLINWEPGRGATVLGVRDDEVDGNYRVSAVVEEELFARAAERITDADLQGLERILDDLEHVVRMRDVAQTAEADLLFHATVAEISGLGLLKHLLAYMHRVSRFRTHQKMRRPESRYEYWFEHMATSHRPLIEALATRDPDVAAKAVHDHLYALKEASSRDRQPLPADADPVGSDSRPTATAERDTSAPPAGRADERQKPTS